MSCEPTRVFGVQEEEGKMEEEEEEEKKEKEERSPMAALTHKARCALMNHAIKPACLASRVVGTPTQRP